MEEALAAVGFASLDILQPSLLVGLRRQMRPLEIAAMLVMPLINPFLRGERAMYRAISVKTVAAAIVGATRTGRKGIQRYTYAGMQALTRLKSVRAAPPLDPNTRPKRT
jgi:hypothetical protein